MSDNQITTSLEETVFYTRKDYLIGNWLLSGNMDRLWQVAEIVNNDSRGVLKEHEDGLRTLDQKSVRRDDGGNCKGVVEFGYLDRIPVVASSYAPHR